MKKKTTRRRKKTRTRKKIIDIEEEDENGEIPIYKKLYPPVKNFFVYDENNEIENKLLGVKSDIGKSIKKKNNFLDDEDEELELDEKFLNNIVLSPCPIPKEKVLDTISKFIQKSKLMDKIAKDYESSEKKNAKTAIIQLSMGCAEKLHFDEYDKGEIIFKIGDSGENFYFILSGNVSVLKLKEIPNIEMTYMEYIRYCIYLLNQGEEYLLDEVLRANESVLNVSSIEDIKLINKIVFMKRLIQDINKKISNNKQLKNYFQVNMQKYSDYDIRQDDLDIFEQEKSKGKQGAGKEWEEYILKRCSLLVSEQVFFQSYENVLTDLEPKKIICYCYEPFLYLGAGLYFGDTALDFENNKRNATIRSEGKTFLAYLQRDDYLNIISPMNKLERIREIEFLYTKFFFFSINSHIFEKNFFHLFSHREYYNGSILFSQGTIPGSLILVKSGRIALELRCSIIDIQNLIKFIFENIFLNPIFQRLTPLQKNRFMSNKKMINIKSYINDPTLMRLKTHNKEFIDEMKIIRTYTITILTDNELIGLEEIFLRMPYITKASVVNNKVDCYELSLNNLDKLLSCGRDVVFSYTKYTMNKISTLIERLQNIKQNYINMSLAKYEVKSNSSKSAKNLNINVNYGKNVNEEIKNNGTKVYINNTSQINTETKLDNTENRIELIPKNNLKCSSPIKLFMTNISPESQTRIKEMKVAFAKLRKNQLKSKSTFYNRLTKQPVNLTNKTLFPKFSNNSKIYKINNKINSKNKLNDTNKKESSLVIYNKDDTFNKKDLIDNANMDNKYENNQTTKTNQIENESNILRSYNLKTRNKITNFTNNHIFNLNYIPLSLICQNEEKIKTKTLINNVNELLTTNKNIQDYLNKKKSIYSSDTNIHNNNNNESDFKARLSNENAFMHQKKDNFKKRLKSLNKNNNISNITKETKEIKTPNIIPRKVIITGIIKDFYKDMKLSGYSSLIKNKQINTIYMRKFNKKYDKAEKVSQNINSKLLKESNSLPHIF